MTTRVSLDLDGVVYDFDRHLRHLWRKRNPGRSCPDYARAWDDCRDDFGFAHISEALDFYTTNVGWLTAPMLPGAYEGVRRLAALPGIEITVITSRPIAAVNQTHAHLHFDFDWPLDRIILADRPKWNYGMDLYIDDSPSEIQHYRDMDVDHVVFDQRWNQHIPMDLSPRVTNWDALVAHVSKVTSS